MLNGFPQICHENKLFAWIYLASCSTHAYILYGKHRFIFVVSHSFKVLQHIYRIGQMHSMAERCSYKLWHIHRKIAVIVKLIPEQWFLQFLPNSQTSNSFYLRSSDKLKYNRYSYTSIHIWHSFRFRKFGIFIPEAQHE